MRPPSKEPAKEPEKEARKHRIELSLRQIILYGSGLVLALAWMFIFGILVGREIPLVDSGELSVKAHVLRFLGLGRQPPPTPENPARTWDPPEKMLESLQYHQNLMEGAAAPLDLSAPKEQPQPGHEQKKAAPQQEAAPENSVERYTLLVSSVRNKDGAQRLVDQLKAKGYASRLESIEKPDSGRWSRVLVGTFESREKAMKFATEFNQREHMEGLIIRQGPSAP